MNTFRRSFSYTTTNTANEVSPSESFYTPNGVVIDSVSVQSSSDTDIVMGVGFISGSYFVPISVHSSLKAAYPSVQYPRVLSDKDDQLGLKVFGTVNGAIVTVDICGHILDDPVYVTTKMLEY